MFCTHNRKVNYSTFLQSALLFTKNILAIASFRCLKQACKVGKAGVSPIKQMELKPQVVNDPGLLTSN